MKKAAFNPSKDRALFQRRALITTGLILLAFATLIGRYFYLQILRHPQYVALSEQNRIKYSRIKSARGLIYDRNGRILAENLTAYRLLATPEKVPNMAESLDKLGEWVALNEANIEQVLESIQYEPVFKPVMIKARLSDREVAAFAARKHTFPGFTTEPYLIRHYHHPQIMSHVIGYVGQLSAEEFDRVDHALYANDDYIGKIGLEKHHELRLHGEPGVLITYTNARGKYLHQEIKQAPVNGENLQLTIDIELQQAAHEAFNEQTGSAIAIDPNTGEILMMLSEPGYNINDFVNGISTERFSALLNSIEKPLFNRSIMGGYEPGSTIKPYIALAGLHHDIISAESTMLSTGVFQLPNRERKYHDWKRGGHGLVNVVDALAQSINTFFYDLAIKLGIDRIHDFLAHFNFGQYTGIDISGEKKGILPSREWKKAARGTIWFPGETVITGIGQGYFLVTPIQMVNALGILASKGRVNRPHLVKQTIEPRNLALDVSESHWQTVHEGMRQVVETPQGSAWAIRTDAYRMAGKSGTSQVYGKSEADIYEKPDFLPKHLNNHALFIAFAPVESPEIAVVVVAEHGASGPRVAAPIARAIIDKFMELKHGRD